MILQAAQATQLLRFQEFADNGEFFETKAAYGQDVVTGFLRLNGATVGAVANRSESYDADGNKTEISDGNSFCKRCKKSSRLRKIL